MTGLRPYTCHELQLLVQYAQAGDRIRYWETRGLNSDPYAKLALEVTLDNSWDGQGANRWLQDNWEEAHARGITTHQSTANNINEFGKQLLIEDLKELGLQEITDLNRVSVFTQRADVSGMDGKAVWRAHQLTADTFQLPHYVWTLHGHFKVLHLLGDDINREWQDIIADEVSDVLDSLGFIGGASLKVTKLAEVINSRLEKISSEKSVSNEEIAMLLEAQALQTTYTRDLFELGASMGRVIGANVLSFFGLSDAPRNYAARPMAGVSVADALTLAETGFSRSKISAFK